MTSRKRMGTWVTVGGFVLAGAALGAVWWGRKQAAIVRASNATSSTGVILGVEELMREVDRHPGETHVEGVVRSTSAQDHLLTLIDTREFDECGVTTCTSLYLPVRWTKEMPEIGGRIRVSGHVEKEADKLIFVAQTLEKVSHP